MDNFKFWQKWLFGMGIIIAAAGAAMSILSGVGFADLLNRLINPAFWGTSDVGGDVLKFQQFVYAILGATMAAWGVLIAFIAHYPFRKREKWAWNAMLVGTLAWFVLDTTPSAYYKVYANVVGNAAFLILILLPVVFSRKHFAK